MHLHSGCMPLNWLLMRHADYGWQTGGLIWLHGRSHTGRTCLAYTAFAEAANSLFFDDYCLFYDNIESNSISWDFGHKVKNRIQIGYSDTIIEFFERCLAYNRPYIYVLDSLTALFNQSHEKTDAIRRYFPQLVKHLAATESLLFILSQDDDRNIPYEIKKLLFACCLRYRNSAILQFRELDAPFMNGVLSSIIIQKTSVFHPDNKLDLWIPFRGLNGIDEILTVYFYLRNRKFLKIYDSGWSLEILGKIYTGANYQEFVIFYEDFILEIKQQFFTTE